MDEPPIKDDPEAEEPQAPAEGPGYGQGAVAGWRWVQQPSPALRMPLWDGAADWHPLYWNLDDAPDGVGEPGESSAGGGPKPAAESAGGRASAHDREPGTIPRFANRVRAVLKDGRFTAEEVGGLNVFIERMIEESGISSQQLGERIRNSEIGIRNAAHPTDPSARAVPALGRDDILDELPGSTGPPVLGRAAGNSEFRIPNSEFV